LLLVAVVVVVVVVVVVPMHGTHARESASVRVCVVYKLRS
jgi:hypothetical protein